MHTGVRNSNNFRSSWDQLWPLYISLATEQALRWMLICKLSQTSPPNSPKECDGTQALFSCHSCHGQASYLRGQRELYKPAPEIHKANMSRRHLFVCVGRWARYSKNRRYRDKLKVKCFFILKQFITCHHITCMWWSLSFNTWQLYFGGQPSPYRTTLTWCRHEKKPACPPDRTREEVTRAHPLQKNSRFRRWIKLVVK